MGVTPTLTAAQSGSNRAPAVVRTAAAEGHCAPGRKWVVRRITPTEGLRLQGFDDAWFDGVVYRGKPLSDSAKYRLIGNSWAVPCVAWIIERMAAIDALLQARVEAIIFRQSALHLAEVPAHQTAHGPASR